MNQFVCGESNQYLAPGMTVSCWNLELSLNLKGLYNTGRCRETLLPTTQFISTLGVAVSHIVPLVLTPMDCAKVIAVKAIDII